MRALTICQPYAHLIVTPAVELPRGCVPKRVENRVWQTDYRGPLLIHAGKSRAWLWPTSEADFGDALVFGALLGVVEILDCIPIHRTDRSDPTEPGGISAEHATKYPWLPAHQHSEGPFGLVLGNVRRFRAPITFNGFQKLWFVPDHVVENAIVHAERVSDPWEARAA